MTTLSLTGAQGVTATLGRLATAHGNAARGVLEPLRDRYRDVLISETPVGQGPASGPRLRERYTTQAFYSATVAEVGIENQTHYLKWVLGGRPAIVAPPGKVLRFEIGGQVFFRRRVKAAKANPYHLRAKAQMQGQIDGAGPAIAAAMVRLARGR